MFSFLILVVVIVLVVKFGSRFGGKQPDAPAGFNPAFRYKDSLALDTNLNVLMAKDRRAGRVFYLKKDDLLRWNEGHWKGHYALELHIRDLNTPTIVVCPVGFGFRAHGEEWYSRITTWRNNT